MENEQKFFVYVDFREDDGKPFYVGKGVKKRIHQLRRNIVHERIKRKHGMVRKILFEAQSEQEALQKEIELIQELKTHIDFGEGGANLTLGGEGSSGYKQSDKQREKLSESVKKKWEDPEYKKKMNEKFRDPEVRKKMSIKAKERWENIRSQKIQQEQEEFISHLLHSIFPLTSFY